jgi:hypothetical protein
MNPPLDAAVRRIGMASGYGLAVLIALYLATLVAGLVDLPRPDAPIRDPYFTAMELLILAIAPAAVALFAALALAAAPGARLAALFALASIAAMAALTMTVHFAVLTLSRAPLFAGGGWDWLFAFRWPSVAYALDILAWDVFFAGGALAASALFPGGGRARLIRALLVASGALALAGLAGVALADMRVRAIGVLGYAVVFPAASALIGEHFRRYG